MSAVLESLLIVAGLIVGVIGGYWIIGQALGRGSPFLSMRLERDDYRDLPSDREGLREEDEENKNRRD